MAKGLTILGKFALKTPNDQPPTAVGLHYRFPWRVEVDHGNAWTEKTALCL